MSNGHAKYSPSKLSGIIQCPGKMRMEAGKIKPIPHPSAEEGQLAHKVCEAILTGGLPPSVFTDDMIECAIPYIGLVGEWGNYESRIDCPNINVECWGTCDAWTFKNGVLKVADYKYGHAWVDVFRNWQLIAYTSGLMSQLDAGSVKSIEHWIVQPRSFQYGPPVRSYIYTLPEFLEKEAQLITAVTLSQDPSAPLIPGSVCKYCLARSACPEFQNSAKNAVVVYNKEIDTSISLLEKVEMFGKIKTALEILKAMEATIEDEMIDCLKKGGDLPGWKIEQGYGRENWNVSVEDAIGIGASFGVNISKPGVMTPAQAKKAGLMPDVVGMYTKREFSKMKLVKYDIKRLFTGGTT